MVLTRSLHAFVARLLVVSTAGTLVLTLSGAVGHRAVAAPGVPGVRVLQTGVEVFSLWRDWPVNTAMLDRVAASGSGWVRVGVGWCSLEEAGPGVVSRWYQDRLDATVTAARQRGLQVLATLGCTPTWLSGSSSLTELPADPGAYQRIATYLATRYQGRVSAWEIWNEPDCATGACPQTDPAAYVPVLRAGYAGIKAADPAATVVTGGVSGANAEWIERMYAAGAQGSFDALAIHPYQGPAAEPPEAPPAEHPYRITNVERVRQVMVEHADGHLPIWFTEFGWTTAPGTGWSAGVDEATQADYLRRAIAMVQERYPYVTHAFVFTIRDRDDWTPYENQFGLLRLDGSPKPALHALHEANTRLSALKTRPRQAASKGRTSRPSAARRSTAAGP